MITEIAANIEEMIPIRPWEINDITHEAACVPDFAR
jgi:hypothetical protein